MPRNLEGRSYRRGGRKETRFETMLRYSNEKEKSARVLGRVLSRILRKDAEILDIGAGNGEYLLRSLQHAKFRRPLRFTFIEPSSDLKKPLKESFSRMPRGSKMRLITQTWQRFKTEKEFDVVLVSHSIYGWHRKNWPKLFAKMIDRVRPGGYLIFVTRCKDDAYRFKQTFRPLFFGPTFQATELGACLEVFKKVFAAKGLRFAPKVHIARSKMRFPIHASPEDAVALIEFYLVKSWHQMDPGVQRKILAFLRQRNFVLDQAEGIAVIRKPLA